MEQQTNTDRKVLALEELAASMHRAIIDMLQHPENDGPDSPAQKCADEIQARLVLVDETILDIKAMLWKHIDYKMERPQ